MKKNLFAISAALIIVTPLHKANFIELAESGKYDSTIFHRVIEGFMIQGGGIDMKENDRDPRTIPAEFVNGFLHHKGSLAAARQGDRRNPKKASSWCQFYIVQGKQYKEEELLAYEKTMNDGKKRAFFNQVIQRPENADLLSAGREYQRERNPEALDSITSLVMKKVDAEYNLESFTDKQRQLYTSVGGAPHLDGEYTVFGKVVDGLEIIDKIAAVEKGPGDKPKNDYFLTMDVEKLPKKKITKLFGFEYPDVDK
jgi:peptidyl-prolyl cis-trans isomerase B (cyclophilin B)